MISTLLPCPFCGNEKNIAMANEKHDNSGGYFIACPACDASTGLRYAMGDDPRPLLVEQWNRRAAIESALRAVPAIPEGWKLVPIEPTPEMVAAYLAENRRYWVATDKVPTPPNKWRTGTPSDATRESYRAMLSASPQAPQAVQPADWTKQTR